MTRILALVPSKFCSITDNVMHRQLDFNYTAETQDRGDGSNNSESITRIVLDKGAFPGSWDYPTGGGDYG